MAAAAQCVDTMAWANPTPTCYPDFVPVCGCDGVTYTNHCFWQYAGLFQYTDGPCEPVAFRLRPNPLFDRLFIDIATRQETSVDLYIFDRNGIMFYHRRMNNVTWIPLEDIPVYGFPQGMYFIMVEALGHMQVQRFVKLDY